MKLNLKPTVGFKLPSAGVTPAPSERKSRNVEDDISLERVLGEEVARKTYLARYFTGEAADRIAVGR